MADEELRENGEGTEEVEAEAGGASASTSWAAHSVEWIAKSGLANRKRAALTLVASLACLSFAVFLAQQTAQDQMSFVRLLAIVVGGMAAVVSLLAFWGVVLGPKLQPVLSVLTGKLDGKGCLVAIGLVGVPYVLAFLVGLVLRALGILGTN